MTKDEGLKLALDKKADNARELGLDYEPENTLHWHALNYRTAPTQNAQAMFEALEKFVEAAIKKALAQPEPTNIERHEANVQKFLGAPQPEQETVAWADLRKEAQQIVESKFLWKKFIDGTPLSNDIACWMAEFAQQYATPPQRTWVSLTDDDWDEIFGNALTIGEAIKATEAKLKEKNT